MASADKRLPEASHHEQPLRAEKPNTSRITEIGIRHCGSTWLEVRPPSSIEVQQLNADEDVIVHEELELKSIKHIFKDADKLKQIFDVAEDEAVRLIIPNGLETYNKNTGEVLVWEKRHEKRYVTIDLHKEEGLNLFVGKSDIMKFIPAALTGPKDDGMEVQLVVEQNPPYTRSRLGDSTAASKPRTSKSIRTKPKHMQANASKSASMKTASTSTSVRRPSSAAARVNAQASRRRQAAQAAGPTSPCLTAQRLNTKENKPAASVTVVNEKVTSLPTGCAPDVPEDVIQEAAAAVTVVPCSPTVKLSWMGMTVDPSKLLMVQQADGTQQLDAHGRPQLMLDRSYFLDVLAPHLVTVHWRRVDQFLDNASKAAPDIDAAMTFQWHEPKNDRQAAQALPRSPMPAIKSSNPNAVDMSTPADKPIPPFTPSTYTIIKKFAPAADEETMAPTST